MTLRSDCAQCLRIDIDRMVAARWPDAGKARGRLVDLESAPHARHTLRPASCMGGPDVDRRPMTTLNAAGEEKI